MKPHNKGKVKCGSGYISKAHVLLNKILVTTSVVSLSIVFLSPLIIETGLAEARQGELVSANYRPIVEIEVEKEAEYENEKHEIISYIVEKFGDDSADAITLVRKCENSTFDQTRTNHNNNGSVDYGVFQINSIHTARFGEEFKTDWKTNVDVAYEIFSEQGWTPWACAEVIGQRPFWK